MSESIAVMIESPRGDGLLNLIGVEPTDAGRARAAAQAQRVVDGWRTIFTDVSDRIFMVPTSADGGNPDGSVRWAQLSKDMARTAK